MGDARRACASRIELSDLQNASAGASSCQIVVPVAQCVARVFVCLPPPSLWRGVGEGGKHLLQLLVCSVFCLILTLHTHRFNSHSMEEHMKKVFACLLLAGSFATLTASPASARNPAGEVMTDRCSSNVSIPPSYDAPPNTQGAVILNRGPNSSTNWTAPFRVQLGGSGHIRWWCQSTTGNWFDVGTWRIDELQVGTVCDVNGNGSSNCRPNLKIKLGSSAWNGWTPERSRCGNRSTLIRARISSHRLLQIECLGR